MRERKPQIICVKKSEGFDMKKSIVYISNEWFIDTDLTVLNCLAKDYTIHWLYSANFMIPRFSIEELKQYAQINGIILHLFDCHSKRISWNYFVLQWRFIQTTRKIKPDLVVRIGFHCFWVLLSFLLRKFKVVYAFHDVISHSNSKLGLLDDLCRDYIVKTNTFFILYSLTQYEHFNQKWPGKIVKNVGMSIKSFGPSNKRIPSLSYGVKLLFFGRIESYKGLDLIIEAMEKIAAKGIHNVQLSIYGKGPHWSCCENLIKHKDLFNENIRFIETSEIADIFSTHHFLVLPYRDATQSGPLMIAANYEMPIFASKLDGFLQVYPIGCGIYYEEAFLVNALEKVSRMTEEEYSELRQNVSELKEKYSKETIAANYKVLFESVLNTN